MENSESNRDAVDSQVKPDEQGANGTGLLSGSSLVAHDAPRVLLDQQGAGDAQRTGSPQQTAVARGTQNPQSEKPWSEMSEEERDAERESLGLPRKHPRVEEDNIDEMMERCGVTREDLNDPTGAICQSGLDKFFAIQQFYNLKEDRAARRAEQTLLEREEEVQMKFHKEPKRRERALKDIQAQRKALYAAKTPPWQMLSGLHPETEREMHPRERRECLRKLILVVREIARKELAGAAGANDKDSWQTPYWDPVRSICFYLGIARTKLTSYCREFSGLALHELVDTLPAKRIEKHMRVELRAFLKQHLQAAGEQGANGSRPVTHDASHVLLNQQGAAGDAQGTGSPLQTAAARGTQNPQTGICNPQIGNCDPQTGIRNPQLEGEAREPGAKSQELTAKSQEPAANPSGDLETELLRAWKALIALRSSPDFSRAEHALNYGYPNYQRYYKTCLLCYRKTPGQMEFKILRELLKEIFERVERGENAVQFFAECDVEAGVQGAGDDLSGRDGRSPCSRAANAHGPGIVEDLSGLLAS